ncbi:MAG TPA: BatA domain-containing protein, partial [Pirellulales bacterium]|nr:BatA domain-containing protein [Pirellulales bacterium]
MPTFAYPALLWGLALLSVPVLIHLINLVRQRHVPWAAMEFLLASQRKNSSWIRFRELLLLALRMAAVAALVLALAQPLLNHELGFRFGRQKTHIFALLDDSFSMSDRQSDASAWDRGKQAIQQIGEEAAQRSSSHAFTLLRYSRARGASGSRPDLLEDAVDAGFGSRLSKLLGELHVSQLAVGPRPGLEAVEKLLDAASGDNVVLYLVSDFRTRDWDEPEDLLRILGRFNQRSIRLQLVACASTRHPNLAIAALAPDFGTRAAAVPVPMEITLRNYSDEPARDVTVALEEDGVARAPVHFDEIPAGASQGQRFASYFATAGQHVISARLGGDAVALDNARWHVLDLPLKVSALIIDGDPESREARFLAALFAPGGTVKTGIEPRIEPAAFLNNNALDGFQSIYLLNVPRLDHTAVEALEKFVREGGGLGIFMGERS